MRVIVVGAGVIGLSAAVRLVERGHEVHVLARDLPLETTSGVAAALWYPYRAAPQDLVTGWAAASYREFARLAGIGGTGVHLREGRELLRRPAPDPWWRSAVPELGRVPSADLPAGYTDGYALRAPVVDMSRYLPWLVGRLETAGGTLTRCALTALPAPRDGVVVNASGLAARALAADPDVSPVRGQVLRVAQVGLTTWTLAQDDPARPVYVVPREHDVIVGGTADEGSYDREVDAAKARDVLARATALVPELAGVRVLGHRVGLRPARPRVRVETQSPSAGGAPIVHCYGHGGAGVTLAWGCAADVVAQVGALDG